MSEHVHHQLFAYVLETLEAEQTSCIRQHLQSCHLCHRQWVEVRDILSEVPLFLQPSGLPPWLGESLQQASNECNRFTSIKRSMAFFTQLSPDMVDYYFDQIDNPAAWHIPPQACAQVICLPLPNKCSLWRWSTGATLPASTIEQHGTVLLVQGTMRALEQQKTLRAGDYCNLSSETTGWRVDNTSPLIYCCKRLGQSLPLGLAQKPIQRQSAIQPMPTKMVPPN